MEQNYNGVAQDPRSEEEKKLDYKYEDLIMGEVILNWVEYNEKNLKSYPIQNQNGSLSCVAQGTSKILAMHEILEGKEYTQLCPKFIYTRRENYPDGGMWLPNSLSIACKYGSCPEVIIPCDNKGESFMNDKTEPELAVKFAETYKGKFYFEIASKNIDAIAQILQQGYGVLLGFRFDYDEWVDVPFVNPNSEKKLGHGVASIDYVLYNNEKALIIEDSWGPGHGKGGRRIITESFLKARCFYAGYITSLPNFVFTKTLRIGSIGIEVRKLQEVLKIQIDGKFGSKTRLAVMVFQLKNLLVPDGVVGIKTRRVLNKNYD